MGKSMTDLKGPSPGNLKTVLMDWVLDDIRKYADDKSAENPVSGSVLQQLSEKGRTSGPADKTNGGFQCYVHAQSGCLTSSYLGLATTLLAQPADSRLIRHLTSPQGVPNPNWLSDLTSTYKCIALHPPQNPHS
jgi:hypothetical protein